MSEHLDGTYSEMFVPYTVDECIILGIEIWALSDGRIGYVHITSEDIRLWCICSKGAGHTVTDK